MKPNVQLGSEEAFFKLLAAATIEPSLQSLIAFDTLDSGLINLANQFGKLLAIACNISAPVDILILDSATTEETLWARFGKCDEGIGWKFSLLVQHDRQEQHKPLLVVIPDLTRLSLPAARACIALLDSETATLQRQGIDLTWRPHFWCLAGCQRDRIGEISSHLLDRFALRVTPPISIHTLPSLAPLERFQWFDNIGNNLTSDEVELPAIAVELAERLREILTATDAMPYLSPKVSDRVLAYFREKRPPGMRRVLTLGRLARALSRLAGENIISVERVERAAQLLGIAQNLPAISSTSSKETNDTKNTATVEPTQDRSNTPLKKTDEVATAKVEQIENVVKPDVTTTFPDAEVTKIEEINSYPEDDSLVDHDLEPLKLPMIESRSPRMGFGHPIGTQSATTLEDISLYGTALEAAKFQRYRNNLPCFQQESPRFRIWRSDLRSYRRIPVPQYLLLCAIDFTCLTEERDWLEALRPHFWDWAYVNRASIGIIRIGAKAANHPLRAELVQARNLLSREVENGLTGELGIATPLAHGLDLAGRTARASLQHGRNRVDRVRLVVLTDGRGNIPLQASLDGELDRPVSQEGIDDALVAAKALSEIPRLEIVLLDPQPPFYAELPQMLAKEMGAAIEKVAIKRSLPTQEVDFGETLEPISLEEVAPWG